MSVPFLTFLIPAYNEASTIDHAIREVFLVMKTLSYPSELLVVDDGSTDQTAIRVEQHASAKLIRHEYNQGKGAAIRTGLFEAKGEWILFLDADLSVHPRAVHELAGEFEQADMLIGSRRLPASRIERSQSLPRILAGRVINRLIRQQLGLSYRDTQCGWKAMRSGLAKNLVDRMQTDGWLFDVELILLAQQRRARIKEVPVVWRNGKESKLNWRHVGKIWREMGEMRKRFG